MDSARISEVRRYNNVIMLMGVVCVIVLTAIIVKVRSGREQSRLDENRAMRNYIRRMSPDRSADN